MDQLMSDAVLGNVVTMPGTGRKEIVIGVNHTYRLEEQDTDGAMVCVEVSVPPGHGVPLHMHHLEDEMFYVLEGTVDFSGDDLVGPRLIAKGGLMYSPRHHMHGFRNPTNETLKLLVVITPGSNIQRMFGCLAAFTERAHGMPEADDVAALCGFFRTTFARPGEAKEPPK